MEQKYSSVRLLRNHIYPTYQLYATMTNSKTTPEDGLHFAVLTVLQWLRERLGDDCPPELHSRSAEEYLQAESDEFPSFYINCGFSLDVVSLPEKGLWAMQLSEPDLGSSPGDAEQTRNAVPGRVIITNVAFRISGRKLACAFQNLISDPEGSPKAPEYRLSVVRRLADAPQFGLSHGTAMGYDAVAVKSSSALASLLSLLKDTDNQLPTVLFVCRRERSNPPVPALLMNPGKSRLPDLPMGGLPFPPSPAPEGEEESCPFDAADFARHQFGYCRTFVLHTSQIAAFRARTGITPPEGGILTFLPGQYKTFDKRWDYDPIARHRTDDLNALREYVRSFTTERAYSFSGAVFSEEAHLMEDEIRRQQGAEADDRLRKHTEDRRAQEQRLEDVIRSKDSEILSLNERLSRREEYTARIEEEKQSALEEIADLKSQIQALRDSDSELERFLGRLRARPDSHLGIPDWLTAQFSGRLLLHDKGRKALEATSADNIDLPLLLDALDYLATDFWENRYAALSTEDALERCRRKYGRPFSVKSLSENTARAFPEYKIKYFPGFNGKPVESLLTDHLAIGNTGGKLLRIYFLYDDKQKLIVIGRLPEHGPTLTIQG